MMMEEENGKYTMIKSSIDKKYKEYVRKEETRWDFGNGILYKMCEEYPKHEKEDVIVGKIWLIGRSYAAAIERRKNHDVYGGDEFYFKKVAPTIKEIGQELDSRMKNLKESQGTITDNIELILSTHKFLMDTFSEISGQEKRSLASKYLHFHCPEKFFIYDSRANSAIRKIVKRPLEIKFDDFEHYDKEYVNSVCRMLELQNYLNNKHKQYLTPRRLDSFLLAYKEL